MPADPTDSGQAAGENVFERMTPRTWAFSAIMVLLGVVGIWMMTTKPQQFPYLTPCKLESRIVSKQPFPIPVSSCETCRRFPICYMLVQPRHQSPQCAKVTETKALLDRSSSQPAEQ